MDTAEHGRAPMSFSTRHTGIPQLQPEARQHADSRQEGKLGTRVKSAAGKQPPRPALSPADRVRGEPEREDDEGDVEQVGETQEPRTCSRYSGFRPASDVSEMKRM